MKAKLTNEIVKRSDAFSVNDIIGWLRQLAFSNKLRRSALKDYSLERSIVAVARIGMFRDAVSKEDSDNYECPTCRAGLDPELKTKHHIKHCPYCGQRLKWEIRKVSDVTISDKTGEPIMEAKDAVVEVE